MPTANRRLILAAALALLVLLVAGVVLMTRPSGPGEDRLSDEAAAGSAERPQRTRCGSQATYDRIKAELFRLAAETRQSDRAAFDRLAAYAAVRMERPLQRNEDEGLGTVRCSGRLSLDLPPGVAVVGGRRTLSADIDYVLQPAADGSGDVIMLEGADPIVVPLATLARSGQGTPLPAPAPPAAPGQSDVLGPLPPGSPPPPEAPARPAAEAPAAPPPVPQAARAMPSFNCRYARTRSEIAVCNDVGLASLDRQMSAQYFRALSVASPRQRALLTTTRGAFLRFRDQCPSDSCIAETYRGRIREIRDIMAGDWQPR